MTVAKASVILTDENPSYGGVGLDFDGGHETVCHSKSEYVRTTLDGLKVHTNTAESFFALLKRGHYGIFHHLSKNTYIGIALSSRFDGCTEKFLMASG